MEVIACRCLLNWSPEGYSVSSLTEAEKPVDVSPRPVPVAQDRIEQIEQPHKASLIASIKIKQHHQVRATMGSSQK